MMLDLRSLCAAISMLVVCGLADATRAADLQRVHHPNLLLNPQEIEQVKEKVRTQPWAADLLSRLKEMAANDGHTGPEPRDAAVVYALTGERKYADMVRDAMLSSIGGQKRRYENYDPRKDPDAGSFGPWAQWTWAYDLTYDTFSPDERKTFETFLGKVGHAIMLGSAVQPTTAGLVFEKHWKVALIGYTIGDAELINWGLHDPGAFGSYLGGVYTLFDANFRDQMFWSEVPHYGMGVVLQGFCAVAEAAQHYDGTDLYHYRSPKSGGTIKGLFDGYLRITYPREATGVNGGSLRLVTFGDGSTGYTASGAQTDTYIMNAISGTFKGPMTLNGEFEIAYARFGDAGYAWLLSLNPKRDGYIGGNRSVWGFTALTHGKPLPEKVTPPPAPSGVYPTQGMAVLRADESPAFWEQDSPMAVLRLGAALGHGHNDYFHLMFHGSGRMLYPSIQLIQYEPNYINWTREGHDCNMLVIDHQSPRPGPIATRQDFAPNAKFFAATGSVFDGVTQTRALVLTDKYLVDVFRAADDHGRKRTFDWFLHGIGRLYPGNPGAYKPTNELVPYYWWVENERGRTTDQTWQADWIQHNAGITPGVQVFGKEWFEHTAGVRMTMLGHPGTQVYHGDGPMVDSPPYALLNGNPEGSIPLVCARREGKAATFVAIHEPYHKKPAVTQIAGIAETEDAVGIAIGGDGFSDRVLVAFAGDKPQTLHNAHETFTFVDHASIRAVNGQVVVEGNMTAFRIHAPGVAKGNDLQIVVNGKPQTARVQGEFITFGTVNESGARSAAAVFNDDSASRAASIHYSFSPEEVHLKAGGERTTTVHLSCVGAVVNRGMSGSITFVPSQGITVDPKSIDVTGMNEGDERDIPVRVKSEPGMASGLYPIEIESTGNVAAPGELTVSVGVVMTRDTRLPLMAQSLVRAPGYTLRLDHRSGTAPFILDSDGHRRHGHIRDDSGAATGLFALMKDDQWLMQYEMPIRFVFEGQHENAPSVIIAPARGDRIRPRYTFHEDHIAVTLTESADPDADYELFLGDFDTLGTPRMHATEMKRKGKETGYVSDAVFYPHPRYRQGLLVTFSKPSAIYSRGSNMHCTLKAGETMEIRFAEEKEVPPNLTEVGGAMKGGKESGDKPKKTK